MKIAIITLISILLAGGTCACLSHPVRDTEVLNRFTGTWEGDGEIVSGWVKQENLHFILTFAPDGTVTGSIGEAQLREGRLRHNGSLTALFYGLRYKVEGALEGEVIAAEGISRERIEIIMKFVDTSLISAASAGDMDQPDNEKLWIYRIRLQRTSPQ
jgi:hypothetical protein